MSYINGFQYRYLSSFTGDVCQYDVDKCLSKSSMNNGTCHNYVGGYFCHCPSGYFSTYQRSASRGVTPPCSGAGRGGAQILNGGTVAGRPKNPRCPRLLTILSFFRE